MQRSPAKDAESTYAKATKAELARDYDSAFRLYIKATESFLHLCRSASATERDKSIWRGQADKALERAERIKQVTGKSRPSSGTTDIKHTGIESSFDSALQLTPAIIDHFSPQEQYYVLKKGGVVNGTIYPLWNEQSEVPGEPREPSLSSLQEEMTAIWKRCGKRASSSANTFLLPQDIYQNIVSDCSVCASIAVCLDYARRFGTNLVEPILHDPSQIRKVNPAATSHGAADIYELKLFFNGHWRRITIDDRLPYHPTLDIPLCLNCTSSDVIAEPTQMSPVWPSLIEKGYLTLMGGYDFPGSNSCIDIHTLLGWIPEHIDIKSPDFERERTWTRIFEGFTSGQCIMTLGTGSDLVNQHDIRLLPAHSYAVIDICETDSERTLTVLDSWVSSTDPIVSSRQKPRVLYISWSEVLNLFDGVYLSWNPQRWESTLVYHGMWRMRDKETSSSRQVRVNIRRPSDTKDGEIWVLLTRHVRDTRQRSAYIALKTQVEDDLTGNSIVCNGQAIAWRGRYTNSSHTLNRVKIPPLQSSGTISISALYDGPPEDVGFSVTVYAAQTRIAWEERTSSPLFTEKLNDELTIRNSGGNSTNPTFMINPQYHLRIHPPKQVPCRSKAKVNLTVHSNKDLPVHIMVVWSQGERVFEPSQKDIVAVSGRYAYGFARVSIELSPGSYNVIVSTFEPYQSGSFSLTIGSSERFSVSRISQEGAGMYSKVLKGAWNDSTAAGAPIFNKYFQNPVFELNLPSSAQIKVRLQVVRRTSGASLNVTVYAVSREKVVEEHVATSGAYDDAISGVATPLTSLNKGTYWIVPSTYNPGVHATFQLAVYSTLASMELNARSIPTSG